MLAGTSPRLPRSLSDRVCGRHDSEKAQGLQHRECRVVLNDIYGRSKWTQPLKKCKVVLHDIVHESKGTMCCQARRCKTCPLINTDVAFRSSYTNRTYKLSGMYNLNCKTSNIIYLITCRKCGFQYVGETGCALRERMNGHRGSIFGKKNTFLAQHFKEELHGYDNMSVQIIEKLDGSSDGKENKAARLKREKYWMKELCTISPFGLNDKIHGVGNMSQASGKIHATLLFNQHKRKKRSHGHRKKRKNKQHTLHRKSLSEIDELVVDSQINLHQLKCALYALPLASLRALDEDALQKHMCNEVSNTTYLIISEIAYLRLHKAVEKDIPPVRYFMKLNFDNKGLDAINIGNILHNKSVRKHIPPYFENTEVPIISYKYTRTIRNDILNYDEVIKNVNLNEYNEIVDCNCTSSPYCYRPHSHIITGNLNIIENVKLRNLIKKGPKYREQNIINWSKNKKIILTAVEKFAKQWCKRENAELYALDDWVNAIKQIVNSRIKTLSKRTIRQPKKILQDPDVKEYLNKFKDKYVLVPADKAGNNIIIVCKYFYLRTIMDELGLTSDKVNNTYKPVVSSKEDIIRSHCKFLQNYKILVPGKCLDLPKFYWLPKVHKTPYKARFIAGSRTCTTKTLSGLLTKGLQAIKNHQNNYCNIIKQNTGINRMWILKNSMTLLSTLKELDIDKVAYVSTWDFSTLYTTIPHDKLIDRIRRLIEFSFRSSTNNYINISDHKVYFSEDRLEKSNYTSWNCKEFCDLFNFLIDNIFIKLGPLVFRQTIGIPMGTDCAPLLADLFLYSYEYEFLESLTKSKALHSARKFNLSFRYIDDLLSLDNVHFKDYVNEIYPPELELKETTESDSKASYLDLLVSTDNNNLNFRLYDKRDDFDFPIVNYPYLDSNIPVKPAYGVYISQLIRYSRACSFYNDFVYRHRLLVNKLVAQGYKRHKLQHSFKRFYNKYENLLTNYKMPLSVHIGDAIYDNQRTNGSAGISTQSMTSGVSDTPEPHIKPNVIHNTDDPANSSNDHTYQPALSTTATSKPPSNTVPKSSMIQSWRPEGLPNLGNTCYLNSIVQCLLSCNHESKFLRNVNFNDIDLIDALRQENNKFDIKRIRDILCRSDPFFRNSEQQDAHEALLKVLHIIHSHTKYNLMEGMDSSQQGSQLSTSLVKRAFYGSFIRTVTCVTCKYQISDTEEFADLVVQVDKDVKTSLSSSMTCSVVKSCVVCEIDTRHNIVRKVLQQPSISLIQINRFKQLQTGRIHKDMSGTICNDKLNTSGFNGYLIAMILHTGTSTNNGHYTSVVRSGESWYICNDSDIKSVRYRDICSSNEVYILFYSRVD